MSLLIDPPRWPAHGTVYSHLVSDVSYAELHAFATGTAFPTGPSTVTTTTCRWPATNC